MPQSLVENYIHLVFSTKYRERILTDAVRPDLHRYMAGIFDDMDSPALAINSVEDHIHILFRLSKNQTIARVVMEVKRGSSRWVKTQDPGLAAFRWQNGYGAFSVSYLGLAPVKRYIARQAAHHRAKKKTFQDEYRLLLRHYRIEYDERYVWD